MDIFNPTDIHLDLRKVLSDWGERVLLPGASERDETSAFDRSLFMRLGSELGLFGVTIPEELGGAGLDPAATMIVLEELSRFDPAFVLSYLSQELLFCHQLYRAAPGHPVYSAYIRRVIEGHAIAGMAMTEPHSGTDVLDMHTRARRDGEFYVINGQKQWITNAPIADLLLVYAKTGESRKDVSLFIVETASEGVFRGEPEHKMGMRSSPTGSVIFQDCRVPAASCVGEPGGALALMMQNLAVERLGLAAQSCGIARSCFDVMSHYAIKERNAFGQNIANFGQIQRYIGEDYAKLSAARSYLYSTVQLLGTREGAPLADGVKLFAAQMAEEVSRDAIQILAANGYSSGYPVERLHRDAILLAIGGGTNEAMQKNITRYWQRVL